MTKQEIIKELEDRIKKIKLDLKDVKEKNLNIPSYNLGYNDALGELLEWIEGNKK